MRIYVHISIRYPCVCHGSGSWDLILRFEKIHSRKIIIKVWTLDSHSSSPFKHILNMRTYAFYRFLRIGHGIHNILYNIQKYKVFLFLLKFASKPFLTKIVMKILYSKSHKVLTSITGKNPSNYVN